MFLLSFLLYVCYVLHAILLPYTGYMTISRAHTVCTSGVFLFTATCFVLVGDLFKLT